MPQIEAAKAILVLLLAAYVAVMGIGSREPVVHVNDPIEYVNGYTVTGYILTEGDGDADFEVDVNTKDKDDPIISKLKVTYRKNGATIEYSTTWDPEPREKEWEIIKRIIKETTKEGKWELLVRKLNEARRR